MIEIEGDDIRIPRGDTGAVTFGVNTTYTFADTDRALFSVKSPSGELLISDTYQIINNEFTVPFRVDTTNKWAIGTYQYDVRFLMSTHWDSDGNITGYDVVDTPKRPRNIQILNTVGEV